MANFRLIASSWLGLSLIGECSWDEGEREEKGKKGKGRKREETRQRVIRARKRISTCSSHLTSTYVEKRASTVFPLVFKSTPPLPCFLLPSPFHFFSSSLVLQLDLRDFFFFCFEYWREALPGRDSNVILSSTSRTMGVRHPSYRGYQIRGNICG